MSSLSVHLRLSEDHSGLPFHPSCPVCRRDRLAGSLAGDEFVSRRTQAAIAAGLLAFSAVGAPAAVAAGPDEDVEGSVEVVESADPGPVDFVDGPLPLIDAGAALPEEDVPDDAAPPVSAPPASDGELPVIEEASSGDAGEPLVEAEAESAAPTVDEDPVANAGPALPTGEAPATTEPEAGGHGPSVDASMGTKRHGRSGEQRPANANPAPREATSPLQAAPVAGQVVAGTSTSTRTSGSTSGSGSTSESGSTSGSGSTRTRTRTRGSTSTSTRQAAAGDRFHVVRRGESLWSIAADLLGDRVTVPRIAREVNRLWALNEDRIASGNPDLLYAGTRLRLR